MLLISSNVYYRIVFVSLYVYYMFTILDYSSALEYSIIRRYTNIVYYYNIYICIIQNLSHKINLFEGISKICIITTF